MPTGPTKPDTPVASKLRCPVVVHRWFATGEGWAWHPDQTPADFAPLSALLADRPSAGQSQTKLLDAGGVCWLCHHAADPESPDPKATDRHPSILRAVALPSRPKAGYWDQLAERLAEFPLPNGPGPNVRLVLPVPRGWLEPVRESQRPVSSAPKGQPAEPRATARRWKWRVLLMAAMGVVVAAVCLVLFWPGVSSGGGVSANDVREKLLKPPGITLSASANDDEVCKQFQRLYSKQGMVDHFFPGAKPDDIRQLAETLHQEGAAKAQGGAIAEHPDVIFARQNVEKLKKFWEAIQYLPDAPQPVAGLGDRLSCAVNDVAEQIPEEARRTPYKKVAGGNAVSMLEEHVVRPLRDAGLIGDGPQRGKYEEWFCRDFRWEAGKPFPWDASADDLLRRVALLFCGDDQPPSDVREAAKEMHKHLDAWGVKGILKVDVEKRPWFVGRAFVEFLSLKHLGLSPDERQKLDGENSFVWQCLGKLEGWHSPAEVNSEKGRTDWKTVQGQLRALDAKIVGSANASSARASDVARAQAIANAIKDGWGSKEWSRFREEYINHQAAAQLQKEISELETKKQQLEAECANLVEKVRGLEAELSKLSLEDPKRPGLEGEREVAKKSWETKHQDLRNCTQDLDKKKEKLANHASRRPLESGNSKVNGLWERLTGQKLDELQKKLNSNQAAPAKANQ